MTESPVKKKLKVTLNEQKRICETDSNCSLPKRKRNEINENEIEKKIIAMKRKNFIKACERVSYESYCDHKKRFMLFVIPNCTSENCKHKSENEMAVSAIPTYVEESFKIEFKTNMWCDALDVCQMCITQKQYLSPNVLKDIVEIIMNAHDDSYSGYSLPYLLDKCKQILSLSFRKHPPCSIKSLKKCYNNFLTSPIDIKVDSFSNRSEFACDKGVVKYCWNRLDYELSLESKDEPLLDKNDFIPSEMKQSVKGLHWQKEKFEIFETLPRTDRIDRLMIVLESVIELLQIDLTIWHSRHKTNQGRHLMRSNKPLMAYILWSDNVLYTGAVNNNCRQIMRIFIDVICLNFPNHYVNLMALWLNIIIQTFYICETNSNSDYPNTGKYCINFGNEFYKLIKSLPVDLVIKVLTMIRPTYMKYIISLLYVKDVIDTKDDNILKITIDFMKKSMWNEFPLCESTIKIIKPNVKKPKSLKKMFSYITNIPIEVNNDIKLIKENPTCYPKRQADFNDNVEINQAHVIYILYITFEAYLDAFSVQSVQNTIEIMNESLNNEQFESDLNMSDTRSSNYERDYTYLVTETFIKKYRTIYQHLKEIIVLFSQFKQENKLSLHFEVFQNINILNI